LDESFIETVQSHSTVVKATFSLLPAPELLKVKLEMSMDRSGFIWSHRRDSRTCGFNNVASGKCTNLIDSRLRSFKRRSSAPCHLKEKALRALWFWNGPPTSAIKADRRLWNNGSSMRSRNRSLLTSFPSSALARVESGTEHMNQFPGECYMMIVSIQAKVGGIM
jgi:hypothetical protein